MIMSFEYTIRSPIRSPPLLSSANYVNSTFETMNSGGCSVYSESSIIMARESLLLGNDDFHFNLMFISAYFIASILLFVNNSIVF